MPHPCQRPCPSSRHPARFESAAPASDPTNVDLSTDWHVAFPGLNKSLDELTLTDWTADPATLHYSGEADFSPATSPSPAPPPPPSMPRSLGGQPIAGAPNSPPERGLAPGVPLAPSACATPLITRTGWLRLLRSAHPARPHGVFIGAASPPACSGTAPYRLEVEQSFSSTAPTTSRSASSTPRSTPGPPPPRDAHR